MNTYQVQASFLYPRRRKINELIIGSEILEAENPNDAEQKTAILIDTIWEKAWNKWKNTHEDNSMIIYRAVNDSNIIIVHIALKIEIQGRACFWTHDLTKRMIPPLGKIITLSDLG
jgi:hypothetical protein